MQDFQREWHKTHSGTLSPSSFREIKLEDKAIEEVCVERWQRAVYFTPLSLPHLWEWRRGVILLCFFLSHKEGAPRKERKYIEIALLELGSIRTGVNLCLDQTGSCNPRIPFGLSLRKPQIALREE